MESESHEPGQRADVIASGLSDGPFSGRETFRQRVREALVAAQTQGWREMVMCDASFADWPLGERACVEALSQWVRGGARKLILLARGYDEVVRQHARFVAWRGPWSHKIECFVCASAATQDLPSALWTPTWALQRFDAVLHNGLSGAEAERRHLLREHLDHWLGQSTPGFPVTTLGL
jgi:hypothetical protein